MSLQSQGPSSIPNNRKFTVQQPRASNDISDISGAAPTQKMNRFTQKPNSYDVSDIFGTKPISLHRQTNSIDYTLKRDDIEGARPRGQIQTNQRSLNPVDPLVPNYQLPSYTLAVEAPMKFLRDTLDVADIDGTRSKPLYKFPMRENFEVNDIQGAHAGWKPRHKRVLKEGPARDIMAVADINEQGVKKSFRCTDPLRPVHFINGMEVKDDMVHTKPRLLPPPRDGPFFSLTTKDIEGATCGWKPPHSMQPPIESRRHFRNTNFVGDIAGAQSDTVKHSIKTNRVTNPLNPQYTGLDGDMIDSTSNVTDATLAAQKSLAYAVENSARQEREVRETQQMMSQQMSNSNSHRSLNNTAEMNDIKPQFQQQTQHSNNQANDERDQMIHNLQREVAELRSSFQPPRSNGGSRPPSYRQASPGAVTQYREPSPQPQPQQNSYREPSPRYSQGGSRGASPAHIQSQSRGPTPRSSGSQSQRSQGALVMDGGSHRGQERMILRSSDGNPRVNMTPREVQQAREYNEDVASVRDL